MKNKEFKYGIEITKPWSQEMYLHNQYVMDELQCKIESIIDDFTKSVDLKKSYIEQVTPEFLKLQKAITGYSYDEIYTVFQVIKEILFEVSILENWHGNQIVKETGIELEKDFIGFK